jgi:hypothetical protein
VLEPELRDRIRAMREGGASLARIADELTAGGVPTAHGGTLAREHDRESLERGMISKACLPGEHRGEHAVAFRDTSGTLEHVA